MASTTAPTPTPTTGTPPNAGSPFASNREIPLLKIISPKPLSSPSSNVVSSLSSDPSFSPPVPPNVDDIEYISPQPEEKTVEERGSVVMAVQTDVVRNGGHPANNESRTNGPKSDPLPNVDSPSGSGEATLLNVVSPESSSSSSPSNVVSSPSSDHSSFSSEPPILDSLPSNVGNIECMSPQFEEKIAEERRSVIMAVVTDVGSGRQPTDNESKTNMPLKFSVSSRFWSKKFGGIAVRLIVLFFVILFLLIGTIVGWVFASITVGTSVKNQGTVSPILFHIVFGVFVVIALIALKECFSRIRAERFAHTHPGEMLPRSRGAFSKI